MASFRPLCLIICLFIAIALATAQPSVTHYHGGYSGGGYRGSGPAIGARSKFNLETKYFEPVTSDGSYTYYRAALDLEPTFRDIFRPDPTKLTLISAVISGNVYDNTTGALAGTFDSSSITTVVSAENQLQNLITMAFELGPEGDDSIFLQGSIERPANVIGSGTLPPPTDFDMAIIGGTGRYKGATGEVKQYGSALAAGEAVYLAEVAVPRFKRF